MVGHRQRDRRHRHLEGHAARTRCGAAPRRGRTGGAAARVAPADGGGEQVEQAEDVRRRRGDLEPVVGAEAERVAPVPVATPIERWVCRTALGSPVVPELNTRTDSSSSLDAVDRRTRAVVRPRWHRRVAASSRSVTVAARAARRAAPRRRRRRPRAPAAVSSRAWSTSIAFHAGLSSTAAAPSLLMPLTAMTNSTRLVDHHRHAVAAADALGERGGGRRRWPSASSSAKVHGSSPARTRDPIAELVGGPLEAVVQQLGHEARRARAARPSSTLPVAFSGSSSTSSTARGTL